MVAANWPEHYSQLCQPGPNGFVWNLNGSTVLFLLERNQHANLEDRLMPLRMSEYVWEQQHTTATILTAITSGRFLSPRRRGAITPNSRWRPTHQHDDLLTLPEPISSRTLTITCCHRSPPPLDHTAPPSLPLPSTTASRYCQILSVSQQRLLLRILNSLVRAWSYDSRQWPLLLNELVWLIEENTPHEIDLSRSGVMLRAPPGKRRGEDR